MENHCYKPMHSSGENNKRVAPRGELCGPRPRSLSLNARVGTDSYKIKKPGAADHRHPPPPPIVIHIRSPEIIHTRPQDFRAVVQQLTGKASASSNDAHQKFGFISAPVVDDCKCKACEISSTGDSVHNDEAEIFSSRDSVRDPQDNDVSASVFAPILPSSWPASPLSVSETSFLPPGSPMITYSEWHEFGPII